MRKLSAKTFLKGMEGLGHSFSCTVHDGEMHIVQRLPDQPAAPEQEEPYWRWLNGPNAKANKRKLVTHLRDIGRVI